MDSLFYESKLPNHKIFNDLKESVLKNPHGKLRNLMELKDDVLYVWNSDGNFLMCLNLKHCEEHQDETPYQKINLVSPPSFAVERLLGSRCGSRLCVWGARGVVVAELPPRWGRASLFDSGNPAVLCKSHSLDERLLYSQGEVRRVHWHPVSLSHVLVLVSDNTIRLYNIAARGGPKLAKVYPIGPKPTSLLAGRTILESLGDTAVDFTPAPDPDSDSLLILRGNGDVYMMECDLDAKTPSALAGGMRGPLAMYPPADDNYGSEACALAALGGGGSGGGGAPALLVVATCSGALYHCLLLPAPTDKDEGGDSHALYVVEAVELNIALNPDDNDAQYSYPVHLYPCTSNTYACVHAGGVHCVTLPILQLLKEYASVDDAETESMLSSICVARSVARHLVCTAPRPPAGLALTAPPLPRLLVLCADCTLLSRTLEPFDLEEQLYKEFQLKNPALEQDDINKLLQERQKLSFTAIIQEILTREVSQPILNIRKSEEPSPKECLEVFTRAAMALRGEYMQRQRRAASAVGRKLAALRALAAQHDLWHDDLKNDIDALELQSTVLLEKCALAEKYQDDLKYRCSRVVRGVRAGAAPSAAEREQLAPLRAHARAAAALAERLLQLRDHARRKSRELKKWEEEYKKKDAVLGKSHSDTIQMILQQQTSQISTLIEDTKLLKDQLNIV